MIFEEPLFHGTDAVVVNMSDLERQEMKKKCFVALKLLFELYNKNEFMKNFNRCSKDFKGYPQWVHIDNDGVPPKEIVDLLSIYLQVQNAVVRNQFYQYDNIYLSRELSKAVYYSEIAFHFGEIGYFAWRILKGMELCRYTLSSNITQEQQEAIDAVINFSKHKPEPLVYCFLNMPMENLHDESGHEKIMNSNVRYIGKLDFSQGNLLDEDAINKIRINKKYW